MRTDDSNDGLGVERTLLILKPDAIKRGLTDTIIKRYTDAGLKIVAKKEVKADKDLIKKHYPETMIPTLGRKSLRAGVNTGESVQSRGKKVLSWLRDYMTSSSIIAIVLEGKDAVQKTRDITGYTDPSEAKKGTVRGDYGKDSIKKANDECRVVRNLVHASGTSVEAEHEIEVWFPELKK